MEWSAVLLLISLFFHLLSIEHVRNFIATESFTIFSIQTPSPSLPLHSKLRERARRARRKIYLQKPFFSNGGQKKKQTKKYSVRFSTCAIIFFSSHVFFMLNDFFFKLAEGVQSWWEVRGRGRASFSFPNTPTLSSLYPNTYSIPELVVCLVCLFCLLKRWVSGFLPYFLLSLFSQNNRV